MILMHLGIVNAQVQNNKLQRGRCMLYLCLLKLSLESIFSYCRFTAEIRVYMPKEKKQFPCSNEYGPEMLLHNT